MITVVLLRDCPQSLVDLVDFYCHSGLQIPQDNAARNKIVRRLQEHMNVHKFPLTLVAREGGNKTVGMVSLRAHERFKYNLTPWLSGLFVAPRYRCRGAGSLLIQEVKKKQKIWVILPSI